MRCIRVSNVINDDDDDVDVGVVPVCSPNEEAQLTRVDSGKTKDLRLVEVDTSPSGDSAISHIATDVITATDDRVFFYQASKFSSLPRPSPASRRSSAATLDTRADTMR